MFSDLLSIGGHLLECLWPIEMLATSHKPDFILFQINHRVLLHRMTHGVLRGYPVVSASFRVVAELSMTR